MTNAQATPGKSNVLIAISTVSVALFFLAIIIFGGLMVRTISIQPELVLGGPVPVGVRALSSYKAEQGVIGEFSVVDAKILVSVAVSDELAKSPAAFAGQELVESVRAYTTAKKIDERLAPLNLKYLSAQLETKYAGQVHTAEISVGGVVLPVATFTVKSDDFISVAIFNYPTRQIVAIARRKKVAPDLKAFSQFLDQLPIIRGS